MIKDGKKIADKQKLCAKTHFVITTLCVMAHIMPWLLTKVFSKTISSLLFIHERTAFCFGIVADTTPEPGSFFCCLYSL